jgi:hypothetical protein
VAAALAFAAGIWKGKTVSTPSPSISLAALQTDIEKLEKKLPEQRKELAAIMNCDPQGWDRTPIHLADRAKALRESIAGMETQHGDLKAARDLILTADFKRKEAEERKAKWKQAQAACRTLKRELEEAQKTVLSLKATRDFLQKQLLDAISLTDAALANPPSYDDYPDDEDFAAHARLCERLKEEQAKAGADFKSADDACLRKMLEERELSGKLANAAHTEINLRPADLNNRG